MFVTIRPKNAHPYPPVLTGLAEGTTSKIRAKNPCPYPPVLRGGWVLPTIQPIPMPTPASVSGQMTGHVIIV